MKTVRQQIIAMYPNHDLAEKKDFIKATVKEVTLLFIHVSQFYFGHRGAQFKMHQLFISCQQTIGVPKVQYSANIIYLCLSERDGGRGVQLVAATFFLSSTKTLQWKIVVCELDVVTHIISLFQKASLRYSGAPQIFSFMSDSETSQEPSLALDQGIKVHGIYKHQTVFFDILMYLLRISVRPL